MSDSNYSFVVIDPESLSKDGNDWTDTQKKSCYEAFEILNQNGYSPKWMKESTALLEQRRRRCYFVFGKFQGTCFDHLAALKIPIYGTPVIIAFKDAKSSKNVLPYPCTPLYSVHFLKTSITFTGLSFEENETYTKIFKYMGGNPSNDLLESTNILVCNNCDRSSSKYVEMARMKRFICQPKLIIETYEKAMNMELFNAGDDEYLHKYTVPLFNGMVFCVSGVRPSIRHDIQNIVEKNGGKYTGHMQNGETTHLLCEEASGTKYKKALEWNIIITKLTWLADSVDCGYLLPYEKYSLINKVRTCSTPNTSTVPNITFGDGNMSSIKNDAAKINIEKLDKRLTIFKDKDIQKFHNKSIRRKSSTIQGNTTETCVEDPLNERTIDDIIDKYINEETSRQAAGLSFDKRRSNEGGKSQFFQGKTFRSLDNQNDNFISKVKKTGGTYIDDTTTVVDYVYFTVNIDSMKSFLSSCCKNKVSDIWLISCLEKKTILDPSTSPFYVPLYIDINKCNELLKNYIIYIFGFNKFETEAIYECIIAAGGKLVSDSELNSVFVTHIITCKPVNKLMENTAFSKSKVVNYIWLTESISKCTVQKAEDFTFYENQNIKRKDVCWLTWHQNDEGSKENDDYSDMFEIFQGRMSIINKTTSLETPLRKMSSLELNNSISRLAQVETTPKLPKSNGIVSNTENEDSFCRSSKISTPSALLRGEKTIWKWNTENSNTTKTEKETELTESFVTSVIDQHLLTMENDFLNDCTTTNEPTDFSSLVKELGNPNNCTTPKGTSPVAKKRKLSVISKTAHNSNLTRLSSRRKAEKGTLLKSPFKVGAIQPEEDNSESHLVDPINVEFAWKDCTQRCPSRTQMDNVKESFGRIVENDAEFNDDSSTIFFPSLEDL